jgi:hypothetical protein
LATIRTGVYIQGADFMAVWKDGTELKDISAGVVDEGTQDRPRPGRVGRCSSGEKLFQIDGHYHRPSPPAALPDCPGS